MAHLIDLICLSIYLSALLKSASNVQTFEADFLASNVQLSDWLRQIWPQMYSCLIGSDRSHEKIN